MHMQVQARMHMHMQEFPHNKMCHHISILYDDDAACSER